MGLTMEFLLSNKDLEIVEAANDLDFDILDDDSCVLKRADFSLHLTPQDLDTLSLVASQYNQQDPMGIRPHLNLIVNEEDHGLFKVNSAWLEYFSKVDPTLLVELAKGWFYQMQKQYSNEHLTVTDAGINAVTGLYELCKSALSQNKSVFHLWYL